MPRPAEVPRPRQLTGPEVSPAVWGVFEQPEISGPYPGVIVIPGSAGWHPTYARVVQSLSESGYAALALDYLAETRPVHVGEQQRQLWPRWQAMIKNAVAYLQTAPSVSGQPVGLIGYSLGAFLAVSVAAALPEVRAVVDFFGGGGRGMASVNEEAAHFPPLLILHGEADSVVPVSYAYSLRDAVAAQGGEVEIQVYPGAEHAFNAPWHPTAYSEPAAEDAWNRMLEFLQRRLRPSIENAGHSRPL